ncbi:hypothetical protein BT93_J1580 [Corymbia citriodora subsp. variegata]|nr:hypothetical protein BT93_J1580 [Corymbia citriodora subsp. variegata]
MQFNTVASRLHAACTDHHQIQYSLSPARSPRKSEMATAETAHIVVGILSPNL